MEGFHARYFSALFQQGDDTTRGSDLVSLEFPKSGLIPLIVQTLDGMTLVKLNVFHCKIAMPYQG